MSKLRIQTTQNVEIDFVVANVGLRILGGLIDVITLILYVILCHVMFTQLFGLDIFEDNKLSSWIGLFFYFFPVTFYSAFLEYLWNGQTIGKKIVGTRVVMIDGGRIGVPQVALRWMFRLLDIWLLYTLPIVGLISMAVTKNTQRLGDLVANTTVIQLKRQVSLSDTIFKVVKEDYTPVFKNVLVLNDKDIRIIKSTLENYSKTRDLEKVVLLAQKAKDLLDIKKNVKPLPMLRTIIKDYNYLAARENN